MKWYLFFTLITLSTSSLGDIQPIYIKCIKNCSLNSSLFISSSSSFSRIFFLWDDLSECQYQCMRKITKEREEKGLKILKYYGHWPYLRFYGIQEPASTLFSICNIIPHYYYLIYKKMFPITTTLTTTTSNYYYYMNKWIYLNGILASIAWGCSTIFHMRKIDITINLDYMSALIFLFHGFWLAFRRTTASFIFNKSQYLSILISFILFSCCLYRLVLMYYNLISFDEHMNLCILLAVLQSILWVLWCIFSSTSSSLRKYCLFLQCWFACASLLELYDFPPIWDYFDAHSLWHASTIPLGFFWYEFWRSDMLENIENDKETEKRKV